MSLSSLWRSLINSVAASLTCRHSTSKLYRSPLSSRLEVLEQRDTPAVVTLVGTTLWIEASNNGDQVNISIEHHGGAGHFHDIVKVHWVHEGNTDDFSFNLFEPYAGQQVKEIYFKGGNGADTVHNDTFLPSSMFGGKGNDKLFGGSEIDYIKGEDGDDEIHGGYGADTLLGGKGSDLLFGDGGNDHLYAYGTGLLDVEASTDILNGGSGNDYLQGVSGALNIMHGGADNDVLLGGSGGQNYLFGDDGNDYLGGIYPGAASGYNYLNGGKGADFLVGFGAGTNILDSGATDGSIDHLYGGLGQNYYSLGDAIGAMNLDVYHSSAKNAPSPPSL